LTLSIDDNLTRQQDRLCLAHGCIDRDIGDEVEASKMKMSHIETHAIAVELGFSVQDFFILIAKVNPHIHYKNQQHAFKNWSALWVFKK